MCCRPPPPTRTTPITARQSTDLRETLTTVAGQRVIRVFRTAEKKGYTIIWCTLIIILYHNRVYPLLYAFKRPGLTTVWARFYADTLDFRRSSPPRVQPFPRDINHVQPLLEYATSATCIPRYTIKCASTVFVSSALASSSYILL